MKNRNLRAPLAVLPLAILATFSSHAQTVVTPDLAETVVTATRVETPLSDVLASVDVLTRQDIDRLQASSLAELLQFLPGYEFGRNGGPGTTTSFFLRGHNSANLVILVDGVRTPVDGIGSLSAVDVPLNAIERVEVLRGDASALYGDAANAGVIHIITRQPQPGAYAGLGVGERGARLYQAGAGLQAGKATFSLVAVRRESARLSAMNVVQRPAANPDADQTVTESVDLRWRHTISDSIRLDARVGTESAEVAYDEDNFGLGAVTDTYAMSRTTNRAQVSLTSQISSAWRTQLSLAGNRQSIEDRKNGMLRTSQYSYGQAQSRHTSLRWENVLTNSASRQWLAGVDYAKERYQSDATASGYQTERTLSALFLGLNQQLGAWAFQGNVRQDEVRMQNLLSDSRKRWRETSALLGAAYELDNAWRVSANIGRGFRVPTSYDLSKSPSLRPEHYLNRELALAYRHGAVQSRVVAFSNQATDMIITHPSTYAQTNTNAKNRGLEWSGAYQWGQTEFNASLTRQNPRNLDTGLALARRSKKLASAGVNHPVGDWSLGAQARNQSERRDQDFNNNVLESYTVVDLLAAYRITPNWKLHMKLENASNRDYQLAYGYNTPRRALWMTLDYTTR
ncbi:TonB-dependent receptor plug domain-containing protein [Hydrogenophaga sp.]|uniref:TonB-dependent receptor plug domain-containing protein n=1 Tax=Hydrogenophaga sp. TaxID=1904254 RepID=UPI003F6AC925